MLNLNKSIKLLHLIKFGFFNLVDFLKLYLNRFQLFNLINFSNYLILILILLKLLILLVLKLLKTIFV